MHNEELHNLYSSFAKLNENDHVQGGEMNRTCSTYGEKRIVYRLLVGKSEERRPLGRPRRRRRIILE
jgi:hypothetical protein